MAFFLQNGRIQTLHQFSNQVKRMLSLITGELPSYLFYPRYLSDVFTPEFLIRLNHRCHSQHDFRRHRSCVTQLLHYVHDLATSLDAGEQIDNIYLDIEKAFNWVSHEKLLYKLKYSGIRNPLLHWIGTEYLSTAVSSDWKYASSGVPQAIIGPILFVRAVFI